MIVLMLALFLSWTEDFESQAYFPPNNWMIVNEDALDAVWYRAECQAHSGVKAAVCYYDTLYPGLSHTNLDYLITPLILPDGNDSTLSFWAVSTTSAGCSLDVMICTSTVPNMTSFTILQTYVITSMSWSQQIVSLASYSGIPIYVAFRARRIPLQEMLGIDDITLPDLTSQPSVCNGRLRSKGPPSQKYLQVWGTNYEMGFAHGYLIASEIMSIYINRWIGYTSYHSVTPNYFEYTYLPWYREKYYIPPKFQEEAEGIIDGITAKGVSLYHPALDRDLTAEDIIVLTGAGDEVDFGCSSLSGWGESTSSDDTLQGGFIIARNVDGKVGLYTTLGNVSFIIAYSPGDPNKQRFFNVNFAGVFGAFSCLNERSVGLCSNSGNHPDTNSIPPNSLLGSLLSSRLAIETIDPDGNGVDDIFDIDFMKNHSEHLRSNEYHVYSSFDSAHPIPGAIIEMNHQGDTMRFTSHNYIPPPINSQWNLAVTNHDRLLHPPVYCGRYQRIADSLNADYHLNTQRAMSITNAVAVNYNYATASCTYHSIVLRPDIAIEHPDWPCVGVSYARCYQAAHTQDKVWYSWNELFEGVPSGVEEEDKWEMEKTNWEVTCSPNPFRERVTMHFSGDWKKGKLGEGEIKIYDISGRMVKMILLLPFDLSLGAKATWDGSDDDGKTLPNGIYFIAFECGSRIANYKVLLLR